VTLVGAGIVTLVFALCVYHHRWLSDDGLIIVRTARQLIAGHGPTFNAFERAEADTCTLWTYLLAAAAWLSSGDAAPLSVALGGIFGVAALPFAIDATRRWQRSRGATGPLVPFGVLVVLGISPF
jgi:arabinofuranosyltransferase